MTRRCWLSLALWWCCWPFDPSAAAVTTEWSGTEIRLADYDGVATVAVGTMERERLEVKLDDGGDQRPLRIAVKLPPRSHGTWAADVVVLDALGQPLPARHVGIEWHRFSFAVPSGSSVFYLSRQRPAQNAPKRYREEDRTATDASTAVTATIARWYDDRRSALSIRFDDAHPTHLDVAVPLLREFGFRGTFMVNPGGSSFQRRQPDWRQCARQGDHELANHSMRHRGAVGDDQVESEIGDASAAIWELTGRRQLLALNLGGGTHWETARPLRYYLDKYQLFDASSGSLGMDDVYGGRAAALRQHLQRHLENRGWCRIHFHAIGSGHNSSEQTFRAALATAKEYQDELWIAGMADVFKYATERSCARLTMEGENSRRIVLHLSCETDPQIYDQQLTIRVDLPLGWSGGLPRVSHGGKEVSVARGSAGRSIRFHVPPRTDRYVIEWEDI